MVDSLKGQDYLNIWGERNGEEIMQREVEEYKSQR
jgi:large subunit ribosomal protein L41